METEVSTEIVGRWSGPFHLRLVLQPSVAAFFAWRDGLADAAADADPFLERIMLNKTSRRAAIASAWASVGKVFVIAFVLDTAFLVATGQGFSLWQSLAVAVLLCAVPYTLVRGPVSRVLRHRKK